MLGRVAHSSGRQRWDEIREAQFFPKGAAALLDLADANERNVVCRRLGDHEWIASELFTGFMLFISTYAAGSQPRKTTAA